MEAVMHIVLFLSACSSVAFLSSVLSPYYLRHRHTKVDPCVSVSLTQGYFPPHRTHYFSGCLLNYALSTQICHNFFPWTLRYNSDIQFLYLHSLIYQRVLICPLLSQLDDKEVSFHIPVREHSEHNRLLLYKRKQS